MVIKGAEADVEFDEDNGIVIKKRLPKRYRIKQLDDIIRRERTKIEAKIMADARKVGVPTPIILDITYDTIKMELINGVTLKEVIDERLIERVGEHVGKMHKRGIVHGDLTTANMIYSSEEDVIYLIDFGLSRYDEEMEGRGVDIHVLFQMLHIYDNYDKLEESFIKGYKKVFDKAEEVLDRVKKIEKRGRYKHE
ncbi:MAG: Kae1-associated kinase Bud32 [Candidatus Methanoliparum thermophilum]|uniref:non-specific serine/threonine protein kinase n=1 Tax=Methanoliparum thermophilum TaxID=2491083 RepID=A0A520KUE9_METT2|nr:MAG: Kae1-associated kinase Bud32 [Candidatus Methanoliparum thermophilum]